jgi:hypothetical protein
MDILFKGTVPVEKVYRGTCPRCHSVLQALRGELRIVVDLRGGETAHGVCAVCTEAVNFHHYQGDPNDPLPPSDASGVPAW